MLFDFIPGKDRPAEELISARYSFLNERLAKFYGIDSVAGEDFQPVDLTEHPERGGLLTQGSFLLVTSNASRTSSGETRPLRARQPARHPRPRHRRRASRSSKTPPVTRTRIPPCAR